VSFLILSAAFLGVCEGAITRQAIPIVVNWRWMV
jgi:hypothetical protein